jgi:hypothetical protein
MKPNRLRDQTALWLTARSGDLHRTIQQEIEALRSSIEERAAALQTMASASDAQIDRFVLEVESLAGELTSEAVAEARQQIEAASHEKLTALRDDLQAELETMRSQFDATRTAFENQLADTERDISTIRQIRDEHAANLEQAGGRIASLERAGAQAQRQQELAEARLEEEVQRRISIEKQLEANRQELRLAKAEADSRRLEAQIAAERRQTLEQAATSGADACAVLTAVQNGLRDLNRAKRDQILDMLVEQLSGHFFAVGVFGVVADGFRLSKASSNDSAVLPAHVSSVDDTSLLAQAFTRQSAVRIDASRGNDAVALLGKPLAHAIAVPILVQHRVLAIVYVESPRNHVGGDGQLLAILAEILVGCVNWRLNDPDPVAEDAVPAQQVQPVADLVLEASKANAPRATEFTVMRQAPRVKIAGRAELFLDGVSTAVVDVSTLGAQVLSQTTLRPNRLVRVVLQSSTGTFTCDARIVWARMESPTPSMPLQCRSGIRFVNSQPAAIDRFIARHRLPTAQEAGTTSN